MAEHKRNTLTQIGRFTKYSLDAVLMATATTVKTPKGTSVTVLIRGEELTAAQKKSINSNMASLFPNVTRIGEPTTNYNCHSYAWYSASTGNKYWMNDPSAYMNDGSFRLLLSNGIQQTGLRVYYPKMGSEHSAIVYQLASNPNFVNIYNTVVRSKWGSAGLYTHKIFDNPYCTNKRECTHGVYTPVAPF